MTYRANTRCCWFGGTLKPTNVYLPSGCTITAEAGGPPALFWGDVIHHPVQLIRHDLKFAFDMDGAMASATRVRKVSPIGRFSTAFASRRP